MKALPRFILLFSVILCFYSCSFEPQAAWVVTTESEVWSEQGVLQAASADTITRVDVTVYPDKKEQTIDGFGACFNELGWLSLSKLEPTEREDIMEELFFPEFGANFTVCRMPIGANDFSRDWYSYNEVDGDFDMKNFTIANDLQTLVPFIKNAQKYLPSVTIWASPWCPPAWMKYNKHYASAYTGENVHEKYRNGLPADKVGHEGTDMFIQDSLYMQAYALYFSKFIAAYKEQGIAIAAVMPQNEFNSAQIFPSCCWTAKGVAEFVGRYLAPAMKEQQVDVLFGTMERPNESLVDTILNDPDCRQYIKGVGFQWAGKDAIRGIHARYPDMKLYQTEQECGDGRNSWQGAMYAWSLMRHYMENGTSAYMYWNIALEKGGISRWGWAQNSLVVVDPERHTYQYTYEYYVMKHVSHYVQPGAVRIQTDGAYTNLLAFQNPDKSVVVVLANETSEERIVSVQLNNQVYQPRAKAHSISTLCIR